MRNLIQLVGGVAVAGVVAAGSTAFTAGGGVALGGTNGATATKSLGGTVSQTVTGATITAIAYTWDNAANTELSDVLLTFADITESKTPTLTLAGLTATPGGTTFTCAPIAGADDGNGAFIVAPFTSLCSASGAGSFDGQLTRLDVVIP